jgi:hypothetical protein
MLLRKRKKKREKKEKKREREREKEKDFIDVRIVEMNGFSCIARSIIQRILSNRQQTHLFRNNTIS